MAGVVFDKAKRDALALDFYSGVIPEDKFYLINKKVLNLGDTFTFHDTVSGYGYSRKPITGESMAYQENVCLTDKEQIKAFRKSIKNIERRAKQQKRAEKKEKARQRELKRLHKVAVESLEQQAEYNVAAAVALYQYSQGLPLGDIRNLVMNSNFSTSGQAPGLSIGSN